jgi:hypothetical protein
MRGGGVPWFVFLRTAATSPPLPPLTCKCEVGVVFSLFLLRWPPHHHHHPPLLANARWGCFSVSFSCNSHHVTATTPPCSQTRVGGGSWLFLSRWLPHHHHHPPLLANTRWGCFSLGLFFSSTANPSLAPTASWRGLSMFVWHHEPPPSPQQRGRVVISIYMYMTIPSLI